VSNHDDEIDGFELEGSELDVVTPSGFQTGIEIDGTSFEDNELDVYVGELGFLKLLKAELEPDVDQPGMGTQFMILNQYETPLTGSFRSLYNYFDDDGEQAIEVVSSTEHIRAKNKDIVWYARVGSYANSINNSLKKVYEQRVFEEESQFFESKYGQSYDAVYPIELNERGFIGTDLTDTSFHTGSIRVAAPLRSVSITKNSFAIPLTRTALRWTQVSASKQFFGNGFSLAIDYLGRAWSWGSNDSGQLGNGTLLSQPSPSLITIPPEHPGTWLSISAGDQHCLGIDTNGKGWAWGNNNSGELGDGTTTRRLVPTPIDTNVSGVQTWKQLSAGRFFSLGISADLSNDGKGWAWGNNGSGQLGVGPTPASSNVPIAIDPSGTSGVQTWKQLSAGNFHSLGISMAPEDGKGWAWGLNFSRLGDGTSTNRNVPIAIDPSGTSGVQTWKQLSASNHSLGISLTPVDGKGWAWGPNLNGQLGDGTTTSKNVPTAINTNSPRPQTWKLLSAGTFHSLGISADPENDSKGWAWGSNLNGQLGDGTKSDFGNDSQPFPAIIDPQNASGVQIWTQLSAGNFHSQGISLDPNPRQSIFRKIWGWGFNGSGAVTFGTEQYQLTPKTFTIGITDEEKNFTLYRSYMFGEGLGGRNLNDVTNGRSYIGGVVGGARSESFVYKNVEFDGYQVEDKVSPYVLMPDDKLVVLCAHQPSPYDISDYLTISNVTNQPSIELNAANLFRTKLKPGFGKIIFYGSYLRDGNPVAPESSQPLTSNSVHEDIRGDVSPYGSSHCLDQFQLEPSTSLRKSYVDRLYEGSIFDEILDLKRFQSLNDWIWIATSTNFFSNKPSNFAIKQDGSLWAWGDNFYGQLGLSSESEDEYYLPTKVGNASWSKVATDGQLTLAIRTDGTLWAWGRNSFKLGLGDELQGNVFEPAQVTINNGSSDDWDTVVVGGTHTLAIKKNGSLWAWGENFFGALGLGEIFVNDILWVPTKIENDSWLDVTAGESHSLGIKTNGTLWAWGRNSSALGLGEDLNGNVFEPRQIFIENEPNNNWKTLGICDCTSYHSMAIKGDGELWAWGWNFDSQLGLGDDFDNINHIRLPTRVMTTNGKWKSIALGNDHTLGIKNNNSLWAWGNNFHGQIGLGDNIRRNTPILVTQSGPFIVSMAAAGSSYSLIIKDNVTLWSWGLGYHGGETEIFNTNFPVQTALEGEGDIDPELKRRLVALSVDGDYLPDESGDSIGTNWSLQRFVRLFSPRETYYDSHVPFLLQTLNSIFDPENFIENPEDYPLQGSSLKLTDKLFFFPFEPSLAGLPRSLNVDEAVKGTDAGSRAFESFQLITGSVDIELNMLSNKQLINLIHGFGDTLDVSIEPDGPIGRNVLRGVRYGLSNPYPKSLSAVFRHDRYGQFRDLLETSLDSAFFGESDQGNDNQLGLVTPPIRIRFVERNTQNVVSDPESTNSQNLSVFATSSFPYFDDIPKDRLTPQPDLGANVLNI
jgi:alpha-tubulin suppressor-like RCC1 family protein